MAKTDKEFAQMAISLGYVKAEQVEEAARLAAKARQMGLHETLAEVLIKKGYLNRAQEAAVLRAVNQPRLTRIGKYALIARIGQGGMGTVYKAKQESLDKIVALKVMAPSLARQRDYVERFIREAQASGQLNHPNIVMGIDAGEADGYYYFAMEFVDGENLKDVLERDGKLPERRALEITCAVAAALEHAHERKIVHRDIKPANIFLAKGGTPKLGDLGLAKEIRTDKSITQAGIPVGTPYYISPEQVRGQEDIDQRADLYALGATLFRMVAGIVPYEGPTGAVVMTRHLNDPIPDPRRTTPDLSDACAAIIHHCMEKDRGARYQNARELREDLEAALAGKPPRHASRPRLRAAPLASARAQREAKAAAARRKMLLAGAAAGALIVGVVIAVAASSSRSRPSVVESPKAKTETPVRPKVVKRPEPRTSAPTKVAPKVDVAALFRELKADVEDARDRDEAETRLRGFIRDHAGSPEAADARAYLAALKAGWKAEDDFRATIGGHIKEHRFAEAFAALKEPPFKEVSEKTKGLLAELGGNVKQAAADYVAAQTARGEDLVQQGDLAGAQQLYEGLGKLGLPEAAAASEAALKKIAELVAARELRVARNAFATLLVKAGELVAEGKLADARAALDPAQGAGSQRLAGMLKAAQGDVGRIEEALKSVERELAARADAGKSARIRGILRPVRKVENGQVTCVGGNFSIHELATGDIEELGCVQDPVLLALLELYRGNAAGARERLEKLAGGPASPEAARVLEQTQWVEAIAREGQAAKVLAEARQLADQNRLAEAGEALARLSEKFGDTAFIEKHRPAIAALSKRVAEAIAAAIRKEEAIKPFIDISEKCGDLAAAIKAHKPVGGWVVDIDNDGLLDVALDIRRGAGASNLVPVLHNVSKPGGEIAFRDVTKEAGIETGDEPVCWADLDGDGDLDIVCRGLRTPADGAWAKDHAKLSLYENRGPERPKGSALFQLRSETLVPDLAKAPGFGGYGFGNIAVLDANGDGRTDLLAQYVSGGANTLILFLAVPGKPFVFADASLAAGFVQRGAAGRFTVPDYLQVKAYPQYVVFDCDGDGRSDFLFNAETGLVFRNRGRAGFVLEAKSSISYPTYASPATGNSPIIIPAVADYDNDGDIDVFVPQRGKNLLLKGQGDGTFKDAMHTTGPMSTDEADSLWATWGDVNNDGYPDLFICNASERNRLYIQKANHAFINKAEEYGATGEKGEKTNFAMFADFDRDGDLDMLLLRDSGRSQLLLNPFVEGDNRYYLSVLIRTPLGAVGARVYLARADDTIAGLQQVCRVEGYNRQTPREAFFGVAAAGEYLVKVVLSNAATVRQRVTIKPSARNQLVIDKAPAR